MLWVGMAGVYCIRATLLINMAILALAAVLGGWVTVLSLVTAHTAVSFASLFIASGLFVLTRFVYFAIVFEFAIAVGIALLARYIAILTEQLHQND